MSTPTVPEPYEGARPGPAGGPVCCGGPGSRLGAAEAAVVVAVVGADTALTLAHLPVPAALIGLGVAAAALLLPRPAGPGRCSSTGPGLS
ncbi:hypothetical protein AB0952_09490 [Streptomyces caniferus]|uniref:hypothetical protein n=1 Tax=Streptomyces caniferus TaxID=285557 RepID=UPI003452BC32